MLNEMFLRARAMKAHERTNTTPPEALLVLAENDKFFIGKLKEPHRTILWLRCVEGLRWDLVAEATYYSRRYIQKKAAEGEKMLKEIKEHGKQS